jgi:hypothetical protein
VPQFKKVLHPVHRRPVDDQRPSVAVAVETEPVAGDAHVLHEPHARQPVLRIGHPEGHRMLTHPAHMS